MSSICRVVCPGARGGITCHVEGPCVVDRVEVGARHIRIFVFPFSAFTFLELASIPIGGAVPVLTTARTFQFEGVRAWAYQVLACMAFLATVPTYLGLVADGRPVTPASAVEAYERVLPRLDYLFPLVVHHYTLGYCFVSDIRVSESHEYVTVGLGGRPLLRRLDELHIRDIGQLQAVVLQEFYPVFDWVEGEWGEL